MTHGVVAGTSGRSSLSGGTVPFKSFVGAVNEKYRVDENWITANAPGWPGQSERREGERSLPRQPLPSLDPGGTVLR
ncbi:hypothetical protein ACWGJB_48500 [Streptomyces sp. NPDC054813]